MGKKGKVETKKKRKEYFALRRKAQKKERQQRLKTRRPLNADLTSIQDGIADIIREQGGQEPTPVAYFGCLFSLIQAKPDPKRLPYFLALIDYYMGDVSQGILQKHCPDLMKATVTLVKQHLADMLIVKKGMQVMKSLFFHLTPTKAMFKELHAMEPNKLHNDHMPIYLRTLQAALLQAHAKKPEVLYDLFPAFVDSTVVNLFDTSEKVASSASKCLKTVFEKGINLAFIVKHKDLIRMAITKLHKCLKDMQYRNNWDLICECITELVRRLVLCRNTINVMREFSVLEEVLVTVDKLRALDDFHFNSAAEGTLGSIVQCAKAEAVLKRLPIDIFELDPMIGRHYLLLVLRRHVSHDRLAFFVQHFAPLITQTKKAADDALLQKRFLESKTLLALHSQIWELLPAFATFPQDLTEGTTYRVIAKELTKLMKDKELCRVACRTFVLLIEKSRYIAEYEPPMEDDEEDEESDNNSEDSTEGSDDEDEDGEDEMMNEESGVQGDDQKDDGTDESLDPVEQIEAQLPELLGTDFCEAPPEADPIAFHMISKEKATEYLTVVATYAKNIVPVICNTIEGDDTERRALLLQTLRSYASQADKAVINSVFKQVCRTLLVSQKAEAAQQQDAESTKKNQTMMEIGCVISEYLDEDALEILLSIIEPLLVGEGVDELLQKKSYKALARIIKTRGAVLHQQLDRFVGILAMSQSTCNAASKRERIVCIMNTSVLHAAVDEIERLKKFVAGAVPEVMMAVKEVNHRTRDTAFNCLATFAELTKVNNFTKMLFAGLAGTTPALVSCTIITLSKIIHEFTDELDPKLKEGLIKSCFMFIKHKSNEIKNAAMSFTRLILKIVRTHEDVKDIVLRNMHEIINGCIVWTSQKHTPGNTRRNVRMILERCIKRFTYDYMVSVFPAEHMKFLEHIEKERKKEVKKALREKELRSKKATETRKEKFNELFYNGDKVKAKAKKEVMKMPGQDAELDLMDDNIVKRFVTQGQQSRILDPKNEQKGKSDGLHAAMVDGKMVIKTEADHKRERRQAALQQKLGQLEGTQRNAFEELSGGLLKRKRGVDDDHDANQDLELDAEAKQAREELRQLQHQLKGTKPRGPKTGESKRKRVEGDVRTGQKFKAKGSAAGDMKVGEMSPYAYVPLNAKYLNKRHRMKSISRVGAVAETAPKGAKATGGRSRSTTRR